MIFTQNKKCSKCGLRQPHVLERDKSGGIDLAHICLKCERETQNKGD